MDEQEAKTLFTMRKVARAKGSPLRFNKGGFEEATSGLNAVGAYGKDYLLVGIPAAGKLKSIDTEKSRLIVGYSLDDFQAFALYTLRDKKMRTIVSHNLSIITNK